MIREILTLKLDHAPVQYYISFDKERKQFQFQPTLQNKAAPSFTIHVEDGELVCRDGVESSLLQQAREKVKEILDNNVFDHFK